VAWISVLALEFDSILLWIALRHASVKIAVCRFPSAEISPFLPSLLRQPGPSSAAVFDFRIGWFMKQRDFLNTS
jgi:hypothetical protein